MAENNEFLKDFYDTDELQNSISNSLSRYSQSTRICQYVPTDHKPSYSEMVDETKYRQLMDDIEKSNVPDDVKYFLRMAATRHLKFTYSKIADYYANSSPEVQKLMEDSILVMIDYDDAVEKGYIKMSKKIDEIARLDILNKIKMKESNK